MSPRARRPLRTARPPTERPGATKGLIAVAAILLVVAIVREHYRSPPIPAPAVQLRPSRPAARPSALAPGVKTTGARSRTELPPAPEAAWARPLEATLRPELPRFFRGATRWSFHHGWLLRHPTLNPEDRYLPEREREELHQLVEQHLPQIVEATREKMRVWQEELELQIRRGQRQPLPLGGDYQTPVFCTGDKMYDLPFDEVLHVRLAAEREATLRAELASAVATWFARKKLMPYPDYLRYLEQVTALFR